MARARAVTSAWRAVRRAKRLLALVSLVDMLVCLPAALYVGMSLHIAARHRTDATQLAKELDLDFMAEVRAQAGFDQTLTLLIIGSLLLFLVARPLFIGGYVGIAARGGERVRFDEFVREGGGVYWKFLRLSLLAMFSAYLLSIAAGPLLEYIDDQAANFETEGPAERYRRITEIVVFCAFWIMGTVLDYARVGVRMHRRPGVIVEMFRSTIFVLQHPLETLGFSALAFSFEATVIWAFGYVLAAADGGYIVTSIVVLILVQLLVALREACRLFHLAGAWRIRARQEGSVADGGPHGGGEDGDDLLDNLPWNP